MNQYKKTARIVGILFLILFVIGVSMYQFLQTPLFSKDFLTSTYHKSSEIIISTILGILSSFITILIAVLLLPIFKKVNLTLAYAYLTFCIVSMIAMLIDNVSVVSILDISKEFVNSTNKNSNLLKTIAKIEYNRHAYTHYANLLISCFPVFVLYYTLYIGKLVPKAISIFGMVSVLLLFTKMLSSIFGYNLSMNMLLPMAIIQIVLPIWLIVKGIKE